MTHHFQLQRSLAVLGIAFTLCTCSPPARDILVTARPGQLFIDFPFSLWRLIGLQNRDYCLSRIELFDSARVLWSLPMVENRWSCRDLTMPIAIGKPLKGFVSSGRPAIVPNSTYGIAIDGIGDARVDFVVKSGRVQNTTNWKAQIRPPAEALLARALISAP